MSPGVFLAIKAIEKGLERGSIPKAVTSDLWCIASVETFAIREVGNKECYLPLSVCMCVCMCARAHVLCVCVLVCVRVYMLVHSGTGSQKSMLILWNLESQTVCKPNVGTGNRT